MGKEYGLFLTGGGGIGAFHIGVIKALEESDIRIKKVCGSSVGALVGGASTYLTADEMFERWVQLTPESVLKIDRSKFQNLTGKKRTLALYRECFLSCCRRDPNLMIDIEDIRKQLYALLDGDKIRKSDIEYGVSTTELPNMKMKFFYKNDMITNPLEYILASIYLPIFSRQKQQLDKKFGEKGTGYIDIARFRRYPIEMMDDCDNIIVVNLEPNNLRVLERPIQLWHKHRHGEIININGLPARSNKNNPVIQIGEHATLVDDTNKSSILDFSRETSDENLKAGYEAGKIAVKKIVKK